STQASTVGLPSDWIALETKTGKLKSLPPDSPIKSVYSFDAYRVWWRIAWDAAWFDAPEAQRYLSTATKHLQQQWDTSSFIPARINLDGQATVEYDATSQYAMLYPALRLIKPDIAEQMLQQKILPQYNQGVWDDKSAYYTQNLAWLGIMPFSVVTPQLLEPNLTIDAE
ncbi:MAG: glycosyl hydrolase, partial [Symploca sp. SIO1B1]|nr:glycosyl hydrolase [Symploca sp. SIO1B1]